MGEVAARTVIVFFALLVLVRLADKRFLARRNALDVMLGLLLGSLLAGIVTDRLPIASTLVAGLILVLLHRLLAWAAFRWHTIGRWVKGDPEVVIRDGVVNEDVLRRHRVSKRDLEEDLRSEGVEDPDGVSRGYLERNGKVTVIRKNEVPPR